MNPIGIPQSMRMVSRGQHEVNTSLSIIATEIYSLIVSVCVRRAY